MSGLKRMVKAVLERTPYRITRAQDKNRFEAISEVLGSIAVRGFNPTRIIDGGANVGTFTMMARRHFPQSKIDMIEPQPACANALDDVRKSDGIEYHPFALVAPDAAGSTVGFIVAPDGVTTGARLASSGNSAGETIVNVEARTLDDIISGVLGVDERLLLKMDLEGHELSALKGSTRTLEMVHVIIVESAFYGDVNSNSPLELASFLKPLGFVLYDVLSMSGRKRDNRARQCDLMFVKSGTLLDADRGWI